jgi:hypothetical protein
MGDHLADDLGALRRCASMPLNHRVPPERLVMLTQQPYLSGLFCATSRSQTVKRFGLDLNHALEYGNPSLT